MTIQDAPVQGPTIPVPTNDAMALEPAKTIGNMMADKAMIRPLIAAGVAIVAQAFRLTLDDALVDNITTIVTTLSVLYAAWSAQHEAAARAREQAEKTRAAVWAPASVADVVTDAASVGDAHVRPVKPPDWTDPETWPDPPMPEPIKITRRDGGAV